MPANPCLLIDKFGDITKNAMKGLLGGIAKGAAKAKDKLDD